VSAPPATGDWHGSGRGYLRHRDGAVAGSLHALAEPPFLLDPVGVRAAWGLADAPDHTVLRGLGRTPSSPPPARARSPASWAAAFEAEVHRLAATARAPALALGGGLDAAAVLAAWRATGAPLPTVLTLRTGLPGYDEVEDARFIATALGARCEEVSIAPAQLVELLPRAVAAIGAPLYNLHPVGRLALARAARARGFQTLVTGDGADAVFAGRPDLDYVPLVAELTRAGGMEPASPFFSPELIAATLAAGPDPEKAALRAYAEPFLGAGHAQRPKHARWMPPLDLSVHVRRLELDRIALELGVPLRLDPDRAAVGFISLELLLRSLREAVA
jgi:asparagine synthetase B (glutamine-hydrolysing)